MTGPLSRRSFVKAAGAASALAGTGLPAFAQALGAGPVALLDPRIKADHGPARPADTVLLTDPLRQWRDGLLDSITARGAIALVRWDMAVMLRHLGREARLAVKVRPSPAALFTVHIAARAISA